MTTHNTEDVLDGVFRYRDRTGTGHLFRKRRCTLCGVTWSGLHGCCDACGEDLKYCGCDAHIDGKAYE